MFINSNVMEDAIAKEAEAKVVASAAANGGVVASDTVFNPFQRGNGCLLSGYVAEELLAHTR